MPQAGFTPIQNYNSPTAGHIPVYTDLYAGELAINTTDEKLYFKNTGGTVKLLASTAVFTTTGSGSYVLATSPTITGHPTIEGVTSTGATGTGKFVFDSAPTITGHPTIEGVTSTGATGTGKFVFDSSPTLSGVTLSDGTANGVVYLNSSKVLTSGSGLVYDSSGNLGLGVVPSAWSGAIPSVLQVGSGASIYSTNVSQASIQANTYYDGSIKYMGTGYATQYQQGSGTHYWYTAPSGTAGNAISFTQAMTLDSSGNLLVGTTSGTGTQKVSWSGPNSGDTATSGWLNVSSAEINIATLFPTLTVSAGATLSFMLQIVTSSGATSATTSRILCLRKGDFSWVFGTPETIGAATITPSGASNTITLTFNVGSQYGVCRVMALSF